MMFRDPDSPAVLDDVESFTTQLVTFNSIFIRLAGPSELGFSALSIVHTLYVRGPSRLSDLQATERIKQSALSTAVSKLVRDGLVLREPDPDDGRASMLHLSAAGIALVRRRHATRVDGLRRLAEALSDDDRATMSAAASMIGALVEAESRSGDPDLDV